MIAKQSGVRKRTVVRLESNNQLKKLFIYYERQTHIPREILLPFTLEEQELVQQYLSGLRGHKAVSYTHLDVYKRQGQ